VALAGDEELVSKFGTANTVIRCVYRDPAATITIRLMEGEPVQIDMGESLLEPEVVMTMDADLAHCFWLGELNITIALARGQLRAVGPVTKVLKLLPDIQPIFVRYRELLEQQGRAGLAGVA
jgi:hypothetical protein